MAEYKGKKGWKKLIPTFETREFEGEIVFDAETKRKRVKVVHEQYYQAEVSKFSVGDKVTVKITNKKRRRTQAQNRYMHLYFSLIAISHGHGVTMEDVKNWAKGKHLSKGITEVFGSKVRKIQGTSELKVLEMLEFIARVECDTNIPAPDPGPFNMGVTHEEYRKLKEEQRVKYAAMKVEAKIK